MTSREYILAQHARETRAYDHDAEMWDKYTAIFRAEILKEHAERAAAQGFVPPKELTVSEQVEINNKVFDSTNWWEWDEVSGSRFQRWDYRKPYSSEYFTQFIRGFMNCQFTSLKRWILTEFFDSCGTKNYLDEVDRDYLEGLLNEAEVSGRLHLDGAILAIYDSDIWESYDPMPEAPLAKIREGYKAKLHGGEAYVKRAILVRKWFQDWKQLEEADPSPNISDTDQDAALPTQSEARAYSDSIVSRKPRGGDAVDREDISLGLAAGITTEECDRIVSEQLHLCPPGTPFKKQSGANAMIWAFAEALKGEDCATVTMPELANLIGRRYGYVVGSKLTDKASKTYHDNRVRSLREAIRSSDKTA